MTIAKIFTAALITVTATASFGATKCDHKGSNGLFANTNPPVVKVQTVKTASASTQSGTR